MGTATSDKVLRSLETHVFLFISNRDITTLNPPDLLIPVRAAEAKQIYEISSRLQQKISAVGGFYEPVHKFVSLPDLDIFNIKK